MNIFIPTSHHRFMDCRQTPCPLTQLKHTTNAIRLRHPAPKRTSNTPQTHLKRISNVLPCHSLPSAAIRCQIGRNVLDSLPPNAPQTHHKRNPNAPETHLQRADATLEGIQRNWKHFPSKVFYRGPTIFPSAAIRGWTPCPQTHLKHTTNATQTHLKRSSNAPMPHWKELKGLGRTFRANLSIGDRLFSNPV